jgi:DNA adenine methylase
MFSNTPLRYPGGKQRLTPFIIEVMEANGINAGHYAEPYAGGAGIAVELLRRKVVSHVHLNDASVAVYAFWRSVLFKTDELCQLIRDADLTVGEWRRQQQILAQPWNHTQLELGFSLFYLNRCNRSGIPSGGVIGGLAQAGKWKMNARFTKPELVRRIEDIAAFRPNITLKNLDAERFILEHLPTLPDDTLIYCDPPYFHKARKLYLNKYTPADHARIAWVMQNRMRHRWLLSYDYSEEILRLYPERYSFPYLLQYCAGLPNKGKELIVVSDDLVVPTSSKVECINTALMEAA